ncbi:MAG TPA: GNAT family N-acetyltransferase [Blastocatellia bacterium]|jgi:putative acetyltransferase|nr:GNAT family N-acetyltransferase [Blastocatellia bacterium]
MLPANLSHLSIRSASNRDGERIAELVFNVLAEYGLSPDPETTDADLKDIETNYLQRGGLFEVVEDEENNLLGSFGIYPIDRETCELRKMYLIPRARGLGLGKYVLQRTIEQAKKLGFKQVVLETSSKLIAANRLYTKFGFKPIDSDHLAVRADQAYMLEL